MRLYISTWMFIQIFSSLSSDIFFSHFFCAHLCLSLSLRINPAFSAVDFFIWNGASPRLCLHTFLGLSLCSFSSSSIPWTGFSWPFFIALWSEYKCICQFMHSHSSFSISISLWFSFLLTVRMLMHCLLLFLYRLILVATTRSHRSQIKVKRWRISILFFFLFNRCFDLYSLHYIVLFDGFSFLFSFWNLFLVWSWVGLVFSTLLAGFTFPSFWAYPFFFCPHPFFFLFPSGESLTLHSFGF